MSSSRTNASNGTRRNSSKTVASKPIPSKATLGKERVSIGPDGRATFVAQGMRRPGKDLNGPFVGRTPISGKKGPRNPISLKEAKTTVDDVINAWEGLDCRLSKEDQRENLRYFYNFVYGFQLNGADVYAILRTARNALRRIGTDVYVPSKGSARISRLKVTSETRGTRGASLDKVMPSFMWDFVINNCEILGDINTFLGDVSVEKLGLDLNRVPDYSQYKSDNAQLVHFVQGVDGFGNCNGNKGWVIRLLDDIDALHLNGQDIQAFFRYFTALTGGPIVNPSKFKVDGLKFEPQAPATRPRKSTKPARVKSSLLWYLVQNFCGNLPVVVPTLEKVFALDPPSKTPTTQVSLQKYKIQQTQPLPYANGGEDEGGLPARKSTVAQSRARQTVVQQKQQKQQQEEIESDEEDSDGESGSQDGYDYSSEEAAKPQAAKGVFNFWSN